MPTFRGPIVARQILLTAHISRPSVEPGTESESMPFRALLDTGATMTMVSSKVIAALGLAPDSWRPITGVHGTVDTPTYTVNLTVPIVEIASSPDGEATHNMFSRGACLEVASHGMRTDAFDILLGMDLLEGFHLTVFQDQFILSN